MHASAGKREIFDIHEGSLPLVVSVPHDGRDVPEDILERMTPRGRELPDTDWHVAQLYDFAQDLGATVIAARYSRYVVDLNRADSDAALYAGQVSTGLCPERTFDGAPIYESGFRMTADERRARVNQYWRPYHQRIRESLDTLVAEHGFALLWDAHSIASTVPRLFDGTLPALNVGTNSGKSCPAAVERAVVDAARQSPFSLAVNERFRGGHITRHFGEPAKRCYAIQLEIAQRCYMDEQTVRYDSARADRLRETLTAMLRAYLETTRKSIGDAV